jgi:hypothetical protein
MKTGTIMKRKETDLDASVREIISSRIDQNSSLYERKSENQNVKSHIVFLSFCMSGGIDGAGGGIDDAGGIGEELCGGSVMLKTDDVEVEARRELAR